LRGREAAEATPSLRGASNTSDEGTSSPLERAPNTELDSLPPWQRPSSYALARLQHTARTGGNLLAELLDTVRSCSLGQITHALYEVDGQYRRSMEPLAKPAGVSDNSAGMNPDFAPLLDYLEKRFDRIESRIDELSQGFSTLQAAVDSYAKRADAYFQEMVALSHKVERHERWLHQIAEKLGVKLEY
jgi:hypothetical protein